MKRNFLNSFLLAVAAITVIACQPKVDNDKEESTVKATADINLSEVLGDGQVATITIESNGFWSITALESGLPAPWITFDTESGSGDAVITATFAKNPSNKVSRTAEITIALLDESAHTTLTVVQSPATYASGITPIVNYITYLNQESDKTTPENGTLNLTNSIFNFNSGASISTTGARIAEVGWVGSEYYRSILVVNNWNAVAPEVLYTIPTNEELSGTLTMFFGIYPASSSKCFVPKAFKMSWSSDNANWTEVEEVYSWNGSDNIVEENSVCDTASFEILPNINKAAYAHRQAIFTIPEGKTITAGGTLYVKLVPSTTYTIKGTEIDPEHNLRICYGSVITQWEKKAYNFNAELPKGEGVILSEGFDNMMSGIDYFAGTKHLAYVSGKTWVPTGGWDATAAAEAFGYVRFAKGGSYITTPALSALGSTPTDINLSFDASVYCSPKLEIDQNNLVVEIAEGDGTVGTVPVFADVFITPEDCATMKNFTVKISGATSNTKIKIGADNRWFIDNIVVTK